MRLSEGVVITVAAIFAYFVATFAYSLAAMNIPFPNDPFISFCWPLVFSIAGATVSFMTITLIYDCLFCRN